MKFIIDSRMRKIEKEYLSKFGELIEIKPQDFVYEEISAHPDIFFCKINDKIFRTPNLNIDIGEPGYKNVSSKYPEDVKYNVCQIGKNVIHNFKYTDTNVLNYIKEKGLEMINVSQGYTNCSISVISENACITSDEKIYIMLKKYDIDCLLLKCDNIRLLDKSGIQTSMNGFIGGATATIGNKFILFGDVKYLDDRNKLMNFIEKYNLELIDFENVEIHDYGGIVQID